MNGPFRRPTRLGRAVFIDQSVLQSRNEFKMNHNDCESAGKSRFDAELTLAIGPTATAFARRPIEVWM